MKIIEVIIKIADDEKRHALIYVDGTWSIDGVIYPRYLELMDTISKFMRMERRHEKDKDE